MNAILYFCIIGRDSGKEFAKSYFSYERNNNIKKLKIYYNGKKIDVNLVVYDEDNDSKDKSEKKLFEKTILTKVRFLVGSDLLRLIDSKGVNRVLNIDLKKDESGLVIL